MLRRAIIPCCCMLLYTFILSAQTSIHILPSVISNSTHVPGASISHTRTHASTPTLAAIPPAVGCYMLSVPDDTDNLFLSPEPVYYSSSLRLESTKRDSVKPQSNSTAENGIA
jgi:hypothetical protein